MKDEGSERWSISQPPQGIQNKGLGKHRPLNAFVLAAKLVFHILMYICDAIVTFDNT